jgi:predicted acylesterase/phospholipase RssA
VPPPSTPAAVPNVVLAWAKAAVRRHPNASDGHPIVDDVTLGDLKALVAGAQQRSHDVGSPCFAAVAGGAGHGPTLGGGLYELAKARRILGVSGVSIGFINAVAFVFGVTAEKLLGIYVDLLQESRILDRHLVPLVGDRGKGLCEWRVMREAIAELIGTTTTMGDAPLPLVAVVTDSQYRRPLMISKRDHPRALVCEVGAATTAIWPIADLQEIPSLDLGNRLWGDGGFCDNLPTSAWDERTEAATVGLRLSQPTEHQRLGDGPLDVALAMAEAALWAGQQDRSKADDAVVVDLPCIGSGFNFDVSPSEVRARWAAGAAAVSAKWPTG